MIRMRAKVTAVEEDFELELQDSSNFKIPPSNPARIGKSLGRLQLPQPASEPRARVCATNVAFGDPDDRTLYITACTHLFKLRTRIPGVRPGQTSKSPLQK